MVSSVLNRQEARTFLDLNKIVYEKNRGGNNQLTKQQNKQDISYEKACVTTLPVVDEISTKRESRSTDPDAMLSKRLQTRLP